MGPYGSVCVGGFAKEVSAISQAIRIMDDELAATDGDSGVFEGINFPIDEGIVDIKFFEPCVGGRRPSASNTTKCYVVFDSPRGLIEDSVVWLSDEKRSGGIESGISNGLSVLMCPFVSHQVRDFIDGHFTNEEILVVSKNRLETPTETKGSLIEIQS